MLGFSPFKKRANTFNYIPRFFNPEKEAREQRRAELHGERSDDPQREYSPGQYIRTQREARAARRNTKASDGQKKILKMIVVVVVALLFIYMLYPRLADVFMRAQRTPAASVEQVEQGFDPYAPITIVPNDYQE